MTPKECLCKICEESNPDKFYHKGSRSTCKECQKKRSLHARLEAELNPPMLGERKVCVRCQVEKDAYHDFYFSNKKVCKSCSSKRTKEWCVNNYTHFLWTQARARATRDSREFTISERDIQIPEFCPVLGMKLVIGRNNNTQKDDSPSIDRIDSTRGYTPDNIKVISYRANTLKNNATLQELLAIVAYMQRSMPNRT